MAALIILVDAATGIVRALRLTTFSPVFSRAFHRAIRAQMGRPWPGFAAYNAQVSTLYAKYRTTDLVPLAIATDSASAGN